MKKIICVLLAIAMLFTFVSCGSPEKKLVGKWVSFDKKGNFNLEFFKDGTYSIHQGSKSGSGTYHVENGQLVVSSDSLFGSDIDTYSYELKKNHLVMVDTNDKEDVDDFYKYDEKTETRAPKSPCSVEQVKAEYDKYVILDRQNVNDVIQLDFSQNDDGDYITTFRVFSDKPSGLVAEYEEVAYKYFPYNDSWYFYQEISGTPGYCPTKASEGNYTFVINNRTYNFKISDVDFDSKTLTVSTDISYDGKSTIENLTVAFPHYVYGDRYEVNILNNAPGSEDLRGYVDFRLDTEKGTLSVYVAFNGTYELTKVD